MEKLNKSDYFTIDEIAKITNRSKNTVYRWIRDGRLNSFKTRLRTVYVHKEEVDKFLREYQIPVY